MRVSEQGLNLIKHFEGCRLTPYRDMAGVATVGYGHTRGVTMDMGPISQEQADAWLEEDVEEHAAAVRRLCPVRLTQGQFDALSSFTFNLGAGALQRSTLRQKVLRGEHGEAAHEFGRWVYAGGRKARGLIRRREAEARLYSGSLADLGEKKEEGAAISAPSKPVQDDVFSPSPPVLSMPPHKASIKDAWQRIMEALRAI